jgi:hypothetical protein
MQAVCVTEAISNWESTIFVDKQFCGRTKGMDKVTGLCKDFSIMGYGNTGVQFKENGLFECCFPSQDTIQPKAYDSISVSGSEFIDLGHEIVLQKHGEGQSALLQDTLLVEFLESFQYISG